VKILSITAGAAGMYCGSCFRDNAMAAELLRRGHDVTLLPVYTPTRTDEDNVSERHRVLFGGISVYLQQRFGLFRALPRAIDRLLDAPGVINAFAGRSVSTDPTLLGDLTVSMLQGGRGLLRREFEKLADWIRHEPLPDVINLPNSLLIAMAAPIAKLTNRPVCCTLQGEELFLDGLQPSYRDQAIRLIREQVPTVARFIAVSEYCARFMSTYLSIPPDRISVVPLGIRFDGYRMRDGGPRGEAPGEKKTIGYFARIAPEKGLHLLADAFINLRRRPGIGAVKLEAAGYLSSSHAPYLERVRKTLADAGLGADFTYRGELDRDGKLAFLRSLDVLSVPATYDEPKGMFLLEAMASGVPVVQPRRGAFVEIVEHTGGGLLVAPDNVDALADGLHRVLTDAALAADLSRRAFDGVRTHGSIERAADRLLAVFENLTRHRFEIS
jgi:glycosyltransferase involved in cell wall biosynthesis